MHGSVMRTSRFGGQYQGVYLPKGCVFVKGVSLGRPPPESEKLVIPILR